MANDQHHIETAAALGKLLKDALNDLSSIEVTAGYAIGMGIWHRYYESEDECTVCLAGAWLAEHGGMDRTETLEFHSLDEDNKLKNKLAALDELREGYIYAAFREMMSKYPDGEWLELNNLMDKEVVCYHDKPNKFKRQMNKLARRLILAGSPDSPGETA